MNCLVKFKLLCAALAVGLAFHSPSAFACAACFGKSDSPLAQGMNWGIFVACWPWWSLSWGGIASFFIYLARKAAKTPVVAPVAELLESTQKA